MKNIKWINNKVCINVLANDLENAKEVYEAAEHSVLVGILSKNFVDNKSAIKEMTKWAKELDNNISIGLGAGDPNQSYMVASLTKTLNPNHANQVFTGVGLTISDYDDKKTIVNCLVSPTGKPGFVKINTGPRSCKETDAIIPVETAIEIIKDMGGDSIKFFPMNGLDTRKELIVLANACAQHNFILEPTGGIDLSNFEEIMQIILDSGVKKIIPHIYTSIIDRNTNKTKVSDIKIILEIIKRITK